VCFQIEISAISNNIVKSLQSTVRDLSLNSNTALQKQLSEL